LSPRRLTSDHLGVMLLPIVLIVSIFPAMRQPPGKRRPVYICLCHGFTDKQVKRAVAEGRRSMREIYACLGGKPRCGKCAGEVRAIVACAPSGGSAEIGAGIPAALQAPQTE